MSTASTKGQHCLLKVKNRPKEKCFKRKGWVLEAGGQKKTQKVLGSKRDCQRLHSTPASRFVQWVREWQHSWVGRKSRTQAYKTGEWD